MQPKGQQPAKTMAARQAGKDSGKDKAKALSPSQRSGLQFPVGLMHTHLKTRTSSPGQVGAAAALFGTPILDYLAAQVL